MIRFEAVLAERRDERPTNRQPSFAIGERLGIKAADVDDEPNRHDPVDLAANEGVINDGDQHWGQDQRLQMSALSNPVWPTNRPTPTTPIEQVARNIARL